jgi:PTS system mannose-specific IIA component
MIGILIVTHCALGSELLKAVEFIMGRLELTDVIHINESTDTDAIRNQIEHKLQNLNKGKGVIILTDMFGGTPSNISLSFLKDGEVEVLTGINLPMLLSIAEHRGKLSLVDLAKRAEKDAKSSISIASHLLEQ